MYTRYLVCHTTYIGDGHNVSHTKQRGLLSYTWYKEGMLLFCQTPMQGSCTTLV